MRETWRLCSRNPAYLVSDVGRVRRIGGRILRPARTDRGYLKVSLGGRCQAYVAHLVAEAFHGERPAGHHVDHLNFDRTDNSARNLRYLPAAENVVRWAGTSAGRILWETPDDVPEGHEPMTDPADLDEWRATVDAFLSDVA